MIKKIVLEIDGKKVELTLEQAEELHGELAKLFKEKTSPVVIKEYEYVPYWRRYWTTPYYTCSETSTSGPYWSNDGSYTISLAGGTG